MSAELYLAGAGLVTPVGFGIEANCAAIRGGLDRLDELPWHDDDGLPIIGAAVTGLDEAPVSERLLALLAAVVEESARRWQVEQLERLVIAWPGDAPGPYAGEAELLAQLVQRSGVAIGALERVLGDESAGPAALERAAAHLGAGVERCLVCGVDSFLGPRRLASLARTARLRSLDESDGIAPAEAAAALWVARRPLYGGGPRVLGFGVGHEPASPVNDVPLRAQGMRDAVASALAQAGLALDQVDYVLSDLGGEAFHFREHALSNQRLHADHPELWHLSEFLGSHGAASGPVAWVVSEHASHQGWAPGRRVLVTASSLDGQRAALLLEHPASAQASAPAERPAGSFAL